MSILPVAFTVGTSALHELTITGILSESLQPKIVLPTILYTILVIPSMVGLAQVLHDSPMPGLHLNESAPEAVTTIEESLHTMAGEGDRNSTGSG